MKLSQSRRLCAESIYKTDHGKEVARGTNEEVQGPGQGEAVADPSIYGGHLGNQLVAFKNSLRLFKEEGDQRKWEIESTVIGISYQTFYYLCNLQKDIFCNYPLPKSSIKSHSFYKF